MSWLNAASTCTKQKSVKLKRHFGGKFSFSVLLQDHNLKVCNRIEHIAKWKKKESELKKAGKQKVSEVGRTIAHTFTSEDSSWKEILEGRRKSNNGAKESTKEEDQHSER